MLVMHFNVKCYVMYTPSNISACLTRLRIGLSLMIWVNNSLDKLHHTRSVAYSAKLLNKHQISGGGAYLDCYHDLILSIFL